MCTHINYIVSSLLLSVLPALKHPTPHPNSKIARLKNVNPKCTCNKRLKSSISACER